MPKENKTLIMKFGGAAVRTPENFLHLAYLIGERQKEFEHIAIVVSAMGDMTDELIALARKVHNDPPRREYDMLVSAGERISIALLAMALAASGREAVSFTGSQSGIITSSHHADARIIDVRPERLKRSLAEGKIVIVAGFQGVSREREITTLGRGGSDTTAVALGVALEATKVEFYKDVKGIFENDPKVATEAHCYPHLTHIEALNVVEKTGGQVLMPRSVHLALRNGMSLHVRSFHDVAHEGTFISTETAGAAPVYEEA